MRRAITKFSRHFWWWLSLFMLILIIGVLLTIAYSRTFEIPVFFPDSYSQAAKEEARLRHEISDLLRDLRAAKLRCPGYPCGSQDAPQEVPSPETPPAGSQKAVPLQERQIKAPIVFILDTSRSMATPLSMPPDQSKRFWNNYRNGDPVAKREAEKLFLYPDPDRRMLHAKRLLLQLVKRVPEANAVGLIRFAKKCPRLIETWADSPAERQAFLRTIEKSRLMGGTPLSAGIAKAALMIERIGGKGVILIISDGDETCLGNPCETAKQIHSKLPEVVINFVRMGGQSPQVDCITQETGGRSFGADSPKELECAMLRAAGVLKKDEPCQ